MPTWKRALLGGAAGAAVVMFLRGKTTAGVILAGVGLATLASEYPEEVAEFRHRLPDYLERGTAYLDAVSRVAERIVEVAERRGSAWHEALLRG